jgi:hypothetical protein
MSDAWELTEEHGTDYIDKLTNGADYITIDDHETGECAEFEHDPDYPESDYYYYNEHISKVNKNEESELFKWMVKKGILSEDGSDAWNPIHKDKFRWVSMRTRMDVTYN